jgi:hypothetical protein
MRKASEKPLLALIEAGGVNDMPVVVPAAATMSDTLIEAIKTAKAAGYRVSKPRKPKIFKRGKDRVGPTIVTRFADGVTTRMSVFTSLENLDWDRGTRLSQAAWESRWRTHQRAHLLKQMGKYGTVGLVMPVPPAIVEAHFEQDGKVLAHYPNSESTP